MKRSLVTAALAATLLLASFGSMPARAADAPYETHLMRLSEILGALHFLRNLCGESSDDWRGRMQALLDAEGPNAERRARLVANFNQGYSAFQANYVTCTESAIEAIARYMREGEALARDITARYGN